MHRLRLGTPGAQDALDTPWQGTYCSQHETHRQCEFGGSTPWHSAFGHRMPGRRASRHSSPQHCASGHSWHGICLPDGARQGIFLLDAAVSGHFPSGRSRVRANGIRTTRVMAPRSRWLLRHGTSQQILSSHSQTCSGFQT